MNTKKYLYIIFANIHFWFIVLTKPKNKDRAFYIYERWHMMQMSALYLFLISIPIVLTMTIALDNPLIPFYIFTTGLNLPLTLIFIARENSSYWAYRKIENDIKSKAQEEIRKRVAKEKQRIIDERIRKLLEEEVRARQEDQRKKVEKERYDKYGKHLNLLGLPIYTNDFSIIKSKYRELIKAYHPDRCDSPNANELTNDIVTAYKELEKLFASK